MTKPSAGAAGMSDPVEMIAGPPPKSFLAFSWEIATARSLLCSS